jgi:predicted ATPase
MFIKQVKLHNEHYPTQSYYPFNVPILRTTSQLSFRKPVTFFVGENGSGKSTLLEAITKKCGIQIWDKPRRHIAHENPYESHLSDFIGVTWSGSPVPGSLFKAETFHDLADFLDDVAICDPGRLKYHGGHILNTLSHGESMLSYFRGRFNIKGLYFLDEPEGALSPSSQVVFLNLLQQLAATGRVQFIIATHSAILMALPQAQIYSFNGPYIKEVAYEETEHYKLYKQFFTDRKSFIDAAPGRVGESKSESIIAV